MAPETKSGWVARACRRSSRGLQCTWCAAHLSCDVSQRGGPGEHHFNVVWPMPLRPLPLLPWKTPRGRWGDLGRRQTGSENEEQVGDDAYLLWMHGRHLPQKPSPLLPEGEAMPTLSVTAWSLIGAKCPSCIFPPWTTTTVTRRKTGRGS